VRERELSEVEKDMAIKEQTKKAVLVNLVMELVEGCINHC
jgi:hypothetical protein